MVLPHKIWSTTHLNKMETRWWTETRWNEHILVLLCSKCLMIEPRIFSNQFIFLSKTSTIPSERGHKTLCSKDGISSIVIHLVLMKEGISSIIIHLPKNDYLLPSPTSLKSHLWIGKRKLLLLETLSITQSPLPPSNLHKCPQVDGHKRAWWFSNKSLKVNQATSPPNFSIIIIEWT